MMGSIGITVGIIGYFLFFSIELLSDLKYRTVRCIPSAAPEALKMWTSCCHGVTLSAVERLAHPAQPRCCRGNVLCSRCCSMLLMASATLARRHYKVVSAAVATCSRAHVSTGQILGTLGRRRF